MATLKGNGRAAAQQGASVVGFHRGKYKPEDFIVPGQDNNGNSIRQFCRVIPLLDRAVDMLFFSRRFPFRAKGDLIRWCIKRGVDELNGMEPVAGSVIIQAEVMMRILNDEELNHAFLTVFHTMSHTVGLHIQSNAIGEARRVVSMMQAQIEKMEEGFWRTRYLRELKERHGHLLDGKSGGAGLGEHVDAGPDLGIDEEGGG